MRRKGNHSHTENAVEAYLRENNVPFIATNEGKRVAYNGVTLKNFDMILPGRQMLLVDIKGRKIRYESAPGNVWENWILKDDVESLKTWSALSSSNQRAFLLYAFSSLDSGANLPNCFLGNTFYFGEKAYAFFVISIEDYVANSKQRSLKPPAVCVSRKLFATLVRPLAELLLENKI